MRSVRQRNRRRIPLIAVRSSGSREPSILRGIKEEFMSISAISSVSAQSVPPVRVPAAPAVAAQSQKSDSVQISLAGRAAAAAASAISVDRDGDGDSR